MTGLSPIGNERRGSGHGGDGLALTGSPSGLSSVTVRGHFSSLQPSTKDDEVQP